MPQMQGPRQQRPSRAGVRWMGFLEVVLGGTQLRSGVPAAWPKLAFFDNFLN